MRDFIVVTGYAGARLHDTDGRDPGVDVADFFRGVWLPNTRQAAPTQRVYVVNGGNEPLADTGCQWVNAEDLGHAHGMPKDQQLSGWSASLLLGCLLAYHNRADLLYKEQDCLAFGGWLDRLYAELGDGGVISGHRNTSGHAKGLLAQSLVLVRREFLLPFLYQYLSIERSDASMVPEDKFLEVGRRTGMLRETSMGYDRSRPVNFDDDAFYLQQPGADELAGMRGRGLI